MRGAAGVAEHIFIQRGMQAQWEQQVLLMELSSETAAAEAAQGRFQVRVRRALPAVQPAEIRTARAVELWVVRAARHILGMVAGMVVAAARP